MKVCLFLSAAGGVNGIIIRRGTPSSQQTEAARNVTEWRAPWDVSDDAIDPFSSSLLLLNTAHNVTSDTAETFDDFFGTRMCNPGFAPPTCSARMPFANAWYVADCPNLAQPNTLDVNVAAADLGGHTQCPYPIPLGGVSPCAYLCYSTAQYGVAVVPKAIWRAAQKAEGAWATSAANQGLSSDRPEEHWEGFQNYASVPVNLGSVIEVGAGPWTQTKGLLFKRPDAQVTEFTVFEPSADWYMANVATCSYTTGKLMVSNPTVQKQYHEFPVNIIGQKGETLLSHAKQYDTLLVMNVIEHVQDGFAFLTGLHRVLKPGGILIFHERFFDSPVSADSLLGTYGLHPIRLMKQVFDVFLTQFQPLLVNTAPTSQMIARNLGEHGYYFVGKKK